MDRRHGGAAVSLAIRFRQKIKWDAALDAALTELWEHSKKSASQIAKELGGGITKNSVLGRVYKLQLTKRSVQGRPRKRKVPSPHGNARPRRRIARPVHLQAAGETVNIGPIGGGQLEVVSTFVHVTPPEDLAIPFEQRKSLLDLTSDTCRWPVGEPGKPDFFFCGGQVMEKLIDGKMVKQCYCAAHYQRAYKPAPKRIGMSDEALDRYCGVRRAA